MASPNAIWWSACPGANQLIIHASRIIMDQRIDMHASNAVAAPDGAGFHRRLNKGVLAVAHHQHGAAAVCRARSPAWRIACIIILRARIVRTGKSASTCRSMAAGDPPPSPAKRSEINCWPATGSSPVKAQWPCAAVDESSVDFLDLGLRRCPAVAGHKANAVFAPRCRAQSTVERHNRPPFTVWRTISSGGASAHPQQLAQKSSFVSLMARFNDDAFPRGQERSFT